MVRVACAMWYKARVVTSFELHWVRDTEKKKTISRNESYRKTVIYKGALSPSPLWHEQRRRAYSGSHCSNADHNPKRQIKKVSIKSLIFIFSFKVCTFLNDKYPNLSPRSFRLSKWFRNVFRTLFSKSRGPQERGCHFPFTRDGNV